MNAAMSPLDQLSTSQQVDWRDAHLASPDAIFQEVESIFEQARGLATDRCERGAPYIAFTPDGHRWRLVQGCCNNWTCPRCGLLRAKEEYGRIVNGAQLLGEMGLPLYFITLTCRGADMPLEDANRDYAKWTNHALTTMRRDCHATQQHWTYVQVTERQQRGHPHSHLLTTYKPDDSIEAGEGTRLASGAIAKRDCLDSRKLVDFCTRAGLGNMADISAVREAQAVAVYIAKYLFKDAMTTEWPKGWKRVRYAQSWPKLPVRRPVEGFPLLTMADWRRLQNLNVRVFADSIYTYEAALARHITNVVPTRADGTFDNPYL